MYINPRLEIPQTVTIVNRLRREDSATNQELYIKTVLRDCAWNAQTTSAQAGTQTSVGAVLSVEIPRGAQDLPYMSYSDWKQSGAQVNGWTVSQGDYVVLGEVSETLTPQNITTTMAQYESFKVRVFKDLTLSETPRGFLQQYADIYYIEGA